MLKGNLKAAAFYGAEAFVLTSHQENFGIAVAEALAYAKPVLISDQINIWREIKQGNAGFIARDTVEGAIEVLQSWEDLTMTEKEKMSQSARQVYESNFTVAAAANDLTDNLKMAITTSIKKKGGEI
jgi:glycosyltransferase involved in cell wall biosynthesis